MCLLRDRGAGRYLLQQTPPRQAALQLMARDGRAPDGHCRRAAVARRTSATLPQTSQRLVAGQTEALPRHLRFAGVPAGQFELVPRIVHGVVQQQRERVRLVPGGARSCSERSGRYESGHEGLHGPQTHAVLKLNCISWDYYNEKLKYIFLITILYFWMHFITANFT